MHPIDVNGSSCASSDPNHEVHLWLVFMRASQALFALASSSFAATGLCDSDFRVLEVLLHKGALPVNTIGPKVDLTPGSISVAVDRLYARGLVHRVERETDRRVRVVSLSDAGRALIEPAFAAHAAVMTQAMSALPPADRVEFERLLKLVGRHAVSMRDGRT